ncbi:tetratricopeptide repeat protein [Dictyobacter alpinus]|uniref:tetratricopeptide repeat protein n=1 Tax=Dictyobacter alpinus TaxID=2014873 RepID=UPI0013874781|nr:tetratricopeptide repeat protein [Dictyobacter alpinus]
MRFEREKRGWSQSKLAELLGTSSKSVGQWERGVFLPSPYFREKLCALFETNAQTLGFLGETDSEQQYIYDPFIPVQGLPSSGLIGRDALINSLIEQLGIGEHLPTLTIYGIPGVGKTALLQALTQMPPIQQYFSDGILWAGLGPHPHLFGHLSRWGHLLQIPDQEMKECIDLASLAKCLRAHIGSRKFLVILDDVWDLSDVKAILVGGNQCVHLVTTRFPDLANNLSQSHTLHVPELEINEGKKLLAYFLPHYTEQEPEETNLLVQEMGMLPLALTLIGKYLSPYDLLGQFQRLRNAFQGFHDSSARLFLEQSQSPIEYHPSIPPKYPLSLERIIAVSFEHLSPEAQRLLCALVLVPAKPNTFSLELATALMPFSPNGLYELVDAGLVETYGKGRYTLHQTISDYAQSMEQAADGEQEKAKQRLIDYALSWLGQHSEDYERIEQEYTNLLAVLELVSAQARNTELVQLVLACFSFWQIRGLYEQAERYLQRALHAVQELSDSRRHIIVLKHLKTIEEHQGSYEQAEKHCQEALVLAQQEGEQEQRSLILSDLGMIELRQGNFGQAERYCQEAVALARQTKDRDQMIIVLKNFGTLMHYQAKYEQAQRYYREGLELARQQGQQEQSNQILFHLGVVAEHQGNYKQAEFWYQEGLELARQLAHREYIIRNLNGLGVIAYRQGNDEQARFSFQEGLELARRLGHRSLICNLLRNLAGSSSRRGNHRQAEIYLQDGLELARQIGNTIVAAEILVDLGECRLSEKQIDQANDAFKEALLCLPKESQEVYAYAHYGLAQVAASRKQFEEAFKHSKESLTIFEQAGHHKVNEVRHWVEQMECVLHEQDALDMEAL